MEKELKNQGFINKTRNKISFMAFFFALCAKYISFMI